MERSGGVEMEQRIGVVVELTVPTSPPQGFVNCEPDVNRLNTRTTTCGVDELDTILNKWSKQGYALAGWCWRSRNLYVLRFYRTATTDAPGCLPETPPEQNHPDILSESATRPVGNGDGDCVALMNKTSGALV